MSSLFVIQGNDQGTRFDLDETQTTIGRDAAVPIRLHDTEVSRRHAAIDCADGRFHLHDLSSSNGTFVNGRQIEHHDLLSGDQVQVGSTLMLFTAPGEESVRRLADKIDITSGQTPGDSSRIVQSITQEEGSRVFDPSSQVGDSPWLARVRANLQVMYRTALAVSHTLEIDQLLERILGLIFEWVEADRGCIMLFDPDTEKLEPMARRDRQQPLADKKISISQTILDYVLERNEGVLTTNAREDVRFEPTASILQLDIREAICVPMQGRYNVVGIIYIDTSTPPEQVVRQGVSSKFGEDHLKLMIAIAHQAALAVEDTRYYSAMVQAERLAAVGQTIATLSHHIKNILQGIRGGSYLIEMGLSDHDEEIVRKGWGIVEKNQTKISALVMDMLTFSKERDPELVPAELNDVLSDVVELMTTRATELDVELDWIPGESVTKLTFDPEGIHRAALNVVTNALDACDDAESGRVVVRSEYDAENQIARVIVEDNGIGIPREDLDNIFTIFVSRKGGRGTGLGLPVSAKILEEHGGRILVESTPGKGSRFTLELPAVPPEA